jgi:hypothetical protein
MIESYQNVSGAHWDLQQGANIQGEAAAAVFGAYIAQKVCLDIFINMAALEYSQLIVVQFGYESFLQSWLGIL